MILKYLIACDGNAKYNRLIKLGCTKDQAMIIKRILSQSEMIDLYRGDSTINKYLKTIGK